MLTKKNSRIELEKAIFKKIMSQKDEFSIDDIIMSMRVVCDDVIKLDEITEIVFNAFDLCLSEGYIDILGRFTYMVDPVKQVAFNNADEDSLISL